MRMQAAGPRGMHRPARGAGGGGAAKEARGACVRGATLDGLIARHPAPSSAPRARLLVSLLDGFSLPPGPPERSELVSHAWPRAEESVADAWASVGTRVCVRVSRGAA